MNEKKDVMVFILIISYFILWVMYVFEVYL